jgi:hypothetical protein
VRLVSIQTERRLSGRRFYCEAENLLAGILQLSTLQFLLAGDAEARPRDSFETFGVDFFAAGDALSEGTNADAVERTLHHGQKLPLIIALMEEEFFVVGVCRLVGDILRGFAVGGTTILLGARYYLPQLLLPLFEPLLERLQLLLVHGFLTIGYSPHLVGLDAMAESKMISAKEKQRQLCDAVAGTQYSEKTFPQYRTLGH